MLFQNLSRRHFHIDGIVESKSEKDLVEFVEGNGAPSFKTEGLTLEQLRDLLLGGPINFKIIRANDSDSSISSKYLGKIDYKSITFRALFKYYIDD